MCCFHLLVQVVSILKASIMLNDTCAKWIHDGNNEFCIGIGPVQIHYHSIEQQQLAQPGSLHSKVFHNIFKGFAISKIIWTWNWIVVQDITYYFKMIPWYSKCLYNKNYFILNNQFTTILEIFFWNLISILTCSQSYNYEFLKHHTVQCFVRWIFVASDIFYTVNNLNPNWTRLLINFIYWNLLYVVFIDLL